MKKEDFVTRLLYKIRKREEQMSPTATGLILGYEDYYEWALHPSALLFVRPDESGVNSCYGLKISRSRRKRYFCLLPRPRKINIFKNPFNNQVVFPCLFPKNPVI